MLGLSPGVGNFAVFQKNLSSHFCVLCVDTKYTCIFGQDMISHAVVFIQDLEAYNGDMIKGT